MLSFLRKPTPQSDNTTTTTTTTTTASSSRTDTPSNMPPISLVAPVGDPDPAAPLLTSFQVRASAGEPVAIVRVNNLQSQIPFGRDAWGRSNKLQPVLLSSEVSFASPFSTSSTDDKLVASETVHYGNLSKTLLGGLDLAQQPPTAPTAGAAAPSASTSTSTSPSTTAIFELLWVSLTGRTLDGSRVALPPDQVPFLDASTLRTLTLTISLPKASLLGAGVSLSTTASFKDRQSLAPPTVAAATAADDDDDEPSPEDPEDPIKNPLNAYSRSLHIDGLHIPTLIGVNPNERLAKQMLVASIAIERFDIVHDDIHNQLESCVVAAMESSSFETLEALGTCIASRILDDFRITGAENDRTMRERGWQVKVLLEKPIAVPFAECPAVEVRMG